MAGLRRQSATQDLFYWARELIMRIGRWASGLAMAFVFVGMGCGTAKPVKVEGIVTLDGNPVEGAMVSFVPEGDEGRPASGLTGSDGVFHLTTLSPEDGAAPGIYKVIVVKSASAGNTGEHRGPEQIKAMMMGGFKKADPK